MAGSLVPGRGLCPEPFLQEELYSNSTGFLTGRFCSLVAPNVHCCLPCPSTDWFYPDNFSTITHAANWVNVAGMACSVFLLVSFAALPIAKTHRHYLSVCLCIATIFMNLGFIVPLAAKPQQCINDITPHDMHSSKTCAVSGAFLLAGGWAGVMWVFLRAIGLHLQICWQIVLGSKFMWGSLVTGWGIPAIGLTIALTLSGVSFRFGDTCHINHSNSLADFWIPLLIFAGATVIIQFVTFGYCIKVYLASLSDNSTTTGSSGLPSYNNSVRTVTPRQAYRRIRRVIELQWRAISTVLLIVADVIFFAVVFVFLDSNEAAVVDKPNQAKNAWLACLTITKVDKKNTCLALAKPLIVNEATVMAVIILLSCNGIWLLLLMGRFTMFTGWYDLVKGKIRPNKEFVSKDARDFAMKDQRPYNILTEDHATRSPDVILTPLSPALRSGSGRETPDYFGREAKYQNPQQSFSSPRAPLGRAWSPSETEAQPRRLDPLSMNKI